MGCRGDVRATRTLFVEVKVCVEVEVDALKEDELYGRCVDRNNKKWVVGVKVARYMELPTDDSGFWIRLSCCRILASVSLISLYN